MDTTATMGQPMPNQTQVVTIGAVHATTTNSLPEGATKVRLYATTNTYVEIGKAGLAATAASMPLVAGVPEYFPLDGLGDNYVDGLQVAAAGSLYVTPMV